jgi:hypothetical protein
LAALYFGRFRAKLLKSSVKKRVLIEDLVSGIEMVLNESFLAVTQANECDGKETGLFFGILSMDAASKVMDEIF